MIGVTTFSLATPACDLDDKDIGETGDTASDSDGDGGGGTTGGDDGDGGGGTTGGDDDGDGGPIGDGDGDVDECTPRDPAVAFNYEFPSQNMGGLDGVSIDWSCTVIAANVDAGLALELDCPETEDSVSIEVTANPPVSVSVAAGATVRVRYVEEGPWWVNRYLRLDTDSDAHLFTVAEGDSLLPPENFGFELPLDVTAGVGGCGGEDECGPFERLDLRFAPNEAMIDGSFAVVGPLGEAVWLVEASEAGEGRGFVCADVPPAWYRMLIVGGEQD